jgi:hypothetical protein
MYRACVKQRILTKGVTEVRNVVSKFATTPVSVETCKIVSRFRHIDGYRICHNGIKGAFPRSLQEFEGDGGIRRMRDAFLKLDLVLPPYYTMQYLARAAGRAEELSAASQLERHAAEVLDGMYSPDSLATLCTGVYRKNQAIAPHCDEIIESVKAHFLGLHRVAIVALLPPVEGIIRNIADQLGKPIRGDVSGDALLKTLRRVQARYIQKIVYADFDWVPPDAKAVRLFDNFDEAVQMIESVRYFVENTLYIHTNRYVGKSMLNRHGIIHALISNYHSPTNYLRLITLLNGLSVASIFSGETGSLLFPPKTSDSTALAFLFTACKNLAPLVASENASYP